MTGQADLPCINGDALLSLLMMAKYDAINGDWGPPVHKPTRRALLAGAATAAILPSGLLTSGARAQAVTPQALRIVKRSLEVNKRAATVFGLANEARGSGLTFTEGDRFAVRLDNASDEPTLVHWHGLTPPWKQDGVPGVTQPMLDPGKSYDYDFTLTRPGTHWMHAHTLQEQQLLAAPLIVRERAAARQDEQEVVVLLHDFSFRSPQEILAGLRGPGTEPAGEHQHGGSNPGSGSGPGSHAAGPGHDGGHMGHAHARDIDYDAFLANDRTLADPEVVRVESGGRVRLRIINGASATGFLIDLGQLDGTLIAVDGQPVAPLRLRRIPMAMAQRIDVRVTLPKGRQAFPILALQEDGTGRAGIVLASKDAQVAKLAEASKSKLGLLDLTVEASLRAGTPLAAKPADRVVDVQLFGSHEGYTWGLEIHNQGEHSDIIAVKRGERVEVRMTNHTMMPHPMHLHGHHFQVIALNGKTFPGALRDTVNLPPHATATIAFDADNPGTWMFHCHHLYHMETGMMSAVIYDAA